MIDGLITILLFVLSLSFAVAAFYLYKIIKIANEVTRLIQLGTNPEQIAEYKKHALRALSLFK